MEERRDGHTGAGRRRPTMRLTGLALVIVLASCATAQPPGDRVEAIDELMTRYEQNGLFSGAVLVAEGGEVVYEGAFGYANYEWMVPNTVDTRFRIASISKPFTMVLVFQLCDEGILDLQGTIRDYLPEYAGPGGDKITVENLVAHSGGIASEGNVVDLDDIERHTWTKEKFRRHIESYELQFEPGTRSAYSNFGYTLLGHIIEAESGKSYAELLQERICEPAGMTDTMLDLNKPLIERRARGYHYDAELGVVNSPYLDMSFCFGAGHLLSTVRDLFRFDTALRGGDLVSPEFLQLMLTNDARRERVGSGRHEEDVFRYGGSINGFLCSTHSYTQDDRYVVVLSNVKDRSEDFLPSTFNVARSLAAVLYGVRYELPDPVESAD